MTAAGPAEGVRLRSVRSPDRAGAPAGTAGAPPLAPASDRPSQAARLIGLGRLPRAAGAVETVFGADERQRIAETALAPWRMLCALAITAPMGRFVGTGWLAGPRTVVTAGHCVYHLGDMGGWASEIAVSPGRDEQATPFGTLVARRFAAVDRWVAALDPDFDVGCIQLDAPVGSTTGWLRPVSRTADELQDWLVNIAGYAADKPAPRDPRAGTQQYFARNRVLRTTDRRIFYDVDTAGGQSGAPVWIQADAEEAPLVVAIHAYGEGGTPASVGVDANSAPRIGPELLEIIEGWIAEGGAGA